MADEDEADEWLDDDVDVPQDADSDDDWEDDADKDAGGAARAAEAESEAEGVGAEAAAGAEATLEDVALDPPAAAGEEREAAGEGDGALEDVALLESPAATHGEAEAEGALEDVALSSPTAAGAPQPVPREEAMDRAEAVSETRDEEVDPSAATSVSAWAGGWGGWGGGWAAKAAAAAAEAAEAAVKKAEAALSEVDQSLGESLGAGSASEQIEAVPDAAADAEEALQRGAQALGEEAQNLWSAAQGFFSQTQQAVAERVQRASELVEQVDADAVVNAGTTALLQFGEAVEELLEGKADDGPAPAPEFGNHWFEYGGVELMQELAQVACDAADRFAEVRNRAADESEEALEVVWARDAAVRNKILPLAPDAEGADGTAVSAAVATLLAKRDAGVAAAGTAAERAAASLLGPTAAGEGEGTETLPGDDGPERLMVAARESLAETHDEAARRLAELCTVGVTEALVLARRIEGGEEGLGDGAADASAALVGALLDSIGAVSAAFASAAARGGAVAAAGGPETAMHVADEAAATAVQIDTDGDQARRLARDAGSHLVDVVLASGATPA